MTLPLHYNSATEYFEKALSFLKEYDWLYNYPNTHIFVNKILERIPPQWVSYHQNLSNEKLKDFAEGFVDETTPISLREFFNTLNCLKPDQNIFTCKSSLNLLQKGLGVGVKKQHEILKLAPIINDICEQRGINTIIDVGVGLGYLSELLHQSYKYNILGLEGDKDKFKLAISRQDKLHPDSKPYVKFEEFFITDKSAEEIRILLEKHFHAIDECVLVGLHACADLSITVLRLFLQLEFVKALVVMPCCYHRLQGIKISGDREQFPNFPASEALKEVHEKFEGDKFLRSFFLRLACQQASARVVDITEEKKEERITNWLLRATLEEVANKENWSLSRKRRKSRFAPTAGCNTIETYIDSLKATHSLTDGGHVNLIDSQKFKENFLDAWQEHKEKSRLLELLDSLQSSIQGLCENVVLLDRVVFLREQGVDCRAYRVTDDRISPRCYALVANKL